MLFVQTVRPLLERRCVRCHGPERTEGGLDLSRREAALAGGETGEAIVPGKPDESLIVQLVEAGEMPKEGPLLTAAEIQALRRWIELGAPYEGEALAARDSRAMTATGRRPEVGEWSMRAESMNTAQPPGGGVGQTAGTMTAGQMGGMSPSGMPMMCPCMQMMQSMMRGMGAMKMPSTMGDRAPAEQTRGAGDAAGFNPRTPQQAKEVAAQYLRKRGNPLLKVGKVRETIATYEVEVLTKDGSLANWIIVDKATGRVRLAY